MGAGLQVREIYPEIVMPMAKPVVRLCIVGVTSVVTAVGIFTFELLRPLY